MPSQVASLFGVLALDDRMTPALKKARGNLTNFSDDVEKSGGGLSKLAGVAGVAGAAMAAAAGAAAVAAVHMASQWDRQLKNIQAVTGATSADMKQLSGELLSIGAHSVAGLTDVTAAFYDIAGGISSAESRMAALKAAVALSEAGNASLAGATQALISVMNSYNGTVKDAAHFSDVLTQTVGKGVGTLDQFASALGPISGLAAKVGVKFDELGASAAFLTTKGASASQAATRLQASMTAMLNPNAAMIAGFRKAGFASGEAAIKQLGLVGAMNALYKASGGSTEKLAKMAGSVEALQAMTALAGDEFAGFAQQFEEGLDGATAAAQKIQLGSFDAQWKMFTNSLGAAATAVGMLVLPALNGLISFINSAMGTVGKFSPLITEGLSKIAGIFQPLLTEINKTTKPIQDAIGNIKNAFDTFFNSLFGDTQISEAGKRLSKKLGETITPDQTLQEKLGPAFAKLKDTIGAELGKIDFVGIATGLLNAAASFGENLARNILKGLLDLGTRVIGQLTAQFAGIDIGKEAATLLNNAIALGTKLVDNIKTGLANLATDVGNWISGELTRLNIAEKAQTFLNNAVAFGKSLPDKIAEGLTNLATGVTDKLGELNTVDIGAAAADLLVNALDFGVNLIGQILDGLLGGGQQVTDTMTGEMGQVNVDTAGSKLVEAMGGLGTKILGKLQDAFNGFSGKLTERIKEGLKDFDLGEAIIGAIKWSADLAGKVASKVTGIGEAIGKAIIEGLKGLAEQLIDAIGKELDKVIPGISARLDELRGKGKAAAGGAGAAMSESAGTVLKNEAARGQGARAAAGGGTTQAPSTLPRAFAVPTGVHGGQMAGGGMNMMPALANALQAQDQAGGADIAAQMQAQLDGAVEKLQPPAGLAAKIASFFSGADVTAALANLGTVIAGSIGTTFGPDGTVMTALKPFEDSWALMFGGGGTIATAAVGMQGTIDGLVASIANISATGTPAIMELESISTSAAPSIAGSWSPVLSVFRELLMVLEGIAGAAARATSAMGAVPGVGGGVAGARAGGGPVQAGKTYLVGENGAELFTAKSNGQIIPNGGTASVGGGGGGMTINGPINIYGVTDVNSMYDQLQRVGKRRNV